jgi:hypothetical protein
MPARWNTWGVPFDRYEAVQLGRVRITGLEER